MGRGQKDTGQKGTKGWGLGGVERGQGERAQGHGGGRRTGGTQRRGPAALGSLRPELHAALRNVFIVWLINQVSPTRARQLALQGRWAGGARGAAPG